MLSNKVHLDKKHIRDFEHRDLRFVDRFSNDTLRCWWVKINIVDQCTSQCVSVPLSHFSVETLKRIDVWETLTEDHQKDILEAINDRNLEAGYDTFATEKEKPTKGRKKRSDYSHLPREINCCKCSNVDSISPAVLLKKVGITVDRTEENTTKLKEYTSTYECAICSPRRRGRERNPLYVDIPRSVKCSGEGCDKECTLSAKAVYELTKGDKGAIEKYCSEYLCRSCNPDWGSWLKGKGRGRKANPENEGFPKKATCISCTKEVSITPKNIREKAARLEITVEELLANYKCRSCGGRLKKKV